MLTISSVSLSGGQGKSTLILFLAKKLAEQGHSVLVVDADPQHSLSTYLDREIEADQPSLLEFLQGGKPEECIVSLEEVEDLYLIPADDGLESANQYLATSGFGALVLRNRLQTVGEDFAICLIDSPPQKSQLCKTVIGAADRIIIPAEVTAKGLGSLQRTIKAIDELKTSGVISCELLGVLPFRDRWFGYNRSKEGQDCIAAMIEMVGEEQLLPPLRESEQFKKAINRQTTLEALGKEELAYPFTVLAEKVVVEISQKVKN